MSYEYDGHVIRRVIWPISAWYDLVITMDGEEMSARIDGREPEEKE